jgi:ornithine decarboxylase
VKRGRRPALDPEVRLRSGHGGRTPYEGPDSGISALGNFFHVGSQQADPKQWRPAIAAAAKIFRICARGGLDLSFVGGGFPGQYRSPIPALSAYADVIHGALMQHFGGAQPQIMVEPSRYLVADAGVLRTEVLWISTRRIRGKHRGRIYVSRERGKHFAKSEVNGLRITRNWMAEDLGQSVRTTPLKT